VLSQRIRELLPSSRAFGRGLPASRVEEAGVRYGVAQIVLLSTERVVRSTSVMGATKRMDEPVKIADMARNMISLAGRSVRDAEHPTGEIQIQFTGLRPGERLHEELIISDDVDRTMHPAIMTVRDGKAVRAIVERMAGVNRPKNGPSPMSARG